MSTCDLACRRGRTNTGGFYQQRACIICNELFTLKIHPVRKTNMGKHQRRCCSTHCSNIYRANYHRELWNRRYHINKDKFRFREQLRSPMNCAKFLLEVEA